MLRFAIRHFTAILIVAALAAWALYYLPTTPTWSVLRLKRAIDARDGDAAALYVDFPSVVKNAGYEMLQQQGSNSPLGSMVGQAAIDVLARPMAALLESWAKQEVHDGDPDLQMPGGAVAGALVFLHRNGGTAYTNFTDPKGQTWEIHMARAADGHWQVTEVANVQQLLEKLKQKQQKRLQQMP